MHGVLSIQLFFRIFQVCWRDDVFRRNERLFEGLEVSAEVETVVGSSGVVDVDLRFIHTNNRPTVERRIAQWNPHCRRLCLCWYCRSHRRMWIICKLASLPHNAGATITRRPRCLAGVWVSPEYPTTCPQTSQNCEYTQSKTNFSLLDTLFGTNEYTERELRIRIFWNIINVSDGSADYTGTIGTAWNRNSDVNTFICFLFTYICCYITIPIKTKR